MMMSEYRLFSGAILRYCEYRPPFGVEKIGEESFVEISVPSVPLYSGNLLNYAFLPFFKASIEDPFVT